MAFLGCCYLPSKVRIKDREEAQSERFCQIGVRASFGRRQANAPRFATSKFQRGRRRTVRLSGEGALPAPRELEEEKNNLAATRASLDSVLEFS